MLDGMALGLDRAEAIDPGHGKLELGVVADPQYFGATLGLEARISQVVSAYVEGQTLWDWESYERHWQALGAMRFRW